MRQVWAGKSFRRTGGSDEVASLRSRELFVRSVVAIKAPDLAGSFASVSASSNAVAVLLRAQTDKALCWSRRNGLRPRPRQSDRIAADRWRAKSSA